MSVPPSSVIDAAVTDSGVEPRFRSVEIDRVPWETVVPPELVFVADSVNVPAPDLVKRTEPETTPEMVADFPDAT